MRVFLLFLLLLILFGYVTIASVKLLLIFLKIIYYNFFAGTDKLDKGYEKYVLSKDERYRSFIDNFDTNFNTFINGKGYY